MGKASTPIEIDCQELYGHSRGYGKTSYFYKKRVMRTAVERKKLHLIQDLLRLESERIIDRIESILKEERLKTLEIELNRPYTEKEFNEMIDRSELDVSEGKVLSTKDLKKKVQSWK